MDFIKRIFFYILISSLFLSCKPSTTAEKEKSNDGLLLATLYMQHSAEYRALCLQTYKLGKLMLDKKLENLPKGKKAAVVVDIDETVLDNSPFSAKSILENTDYPLYWDEWCNQASAKSIPGALEFLNYATDLGVETFYISNRKIHLLEPTLQNLQKNGFPFADTAHILLRTHTSNKEERRNKVRETHQILMFFGDNLGDFNAAFDEKPSVQRNKLVKQMKAQIGEDYIVFPNPTYGAWLDALKRENITIKSQDSLYKSKLIDF
jgi:5'-nucleotidase (lipoprotein e(P4) family)